MAPPRGIVAILLAASLGLSVHAGPCKHQSPSLASPSSSTINASPTSSTSDILGTPSPSTPVVVESTPISTPVITPSSSSSNTPIATPSSTPALTPSSNTPVATPSSTPVPTPSSSAVAPPACVPSQLLVNRAFDDNNDGSPWVLGDGVTVSQINPRSAPNFLYNTITQARRTVTFSQALPALGPSSYQLEYYFNLQTAINGRGFSCSIVPSINSQLLLPSITLTDSGPYGFRFSTQTFTALDQTSPATLTISVSCQGNFNTIIIGADDFALTRLCSV